MKPRHSRKLSILGAIVFTANAAHGDAITQTTSDGFGSASFVDSARWSNLQVPSPGNTYSTNGFVFRTPGVSTSPITFGGDSLTVETRSAASGTPGNTVITKGSSNQTIHFPQLILNGGIFSQGQENTTHTIGGAITANATSGFSISDSSNRNLFISAPISGAGRLHVGSFGQYNAGDPSYVPNAFTSTFAVSGDNNSFSGGWTLGGGYDATFFGDVSTYRINFNSSGITFRLDHVNALGTGALEIHAGTVNLNGFSPTVPSLTVADDGSATIRSAGSTLTASSLNLGTSTGATFKIDNGSLSNPVTAPIVSTTLTVNGPSTIGVLGSGLSTGTFPLISHAGAIAGPTGFGDLTLALPPGVEGNLVDNPGSLDVQIDSIEFIKWTNGDATGDWNIDTDFNWMTAVGLDATTYQQNESGGHSVLFDESEPEASPVAIHIPATVSPNAISINNPNKDYVFSGSAISGTGAFVKEGAGTATFSNLLGSSGGITVNGGKVVVGATPAGTTAAPRTVTTAAGGTLEYTKETQINQGATLYSGGGTLLKTGAGTLLYDGSNSTIAMDPGGLIDVQAGKIQFGNWNATGCTAAANQSDMNIADGATFDAYSANVAVNELTGSGTYQAGYFGPRSLTVGIADGSSTFSGTIIGNGVNGDSQAQLIKRGTGTLTLTGKVNARGAYGGSSVEVRGGTLESPSTLVLSPTDVTSTTGYSGGGIFISPGNTDFTVFEQTAGTLVANLIAVGEQGQGTFNFAGGTVNAGRLEMARTGGGNNGPAVMNISDTAVLNVNNNGQILMGQYWGRQVTVNQDGGEVIQFSDAGVTRGGTGKMNFFGGNPNSTWNLYGGTLSIAGIDWAAAGGGAGGGNGTLNFNGGTLQITSAAFGVPTGEANGKPVVSLTVLGDEITPDSGAIIDNFGLDVNIAAGILNGTGGFFDGGLRLNSSVPGGSLTLQGTNTYTGTTTVDAGNTLVLDSGAELRFLIDGTSCNKLTGAGTATLNGIFNIDTTFGETAPGTDWTLVDITNRTYGGGFSVAGFSNNAGVWTRDDGFGNLWTFTQSTGVLEVAGGTTGGYNSWITGFSLNGEDQPGDDPDDDGLNNLLEFVLNGDPSVSDSSIQPALHVTATDFEFTYQRRDDSIAPETTQTFEWGTTLGAWPGSAEIPATSGTVGVATITVTPGVPDDDVTDTVKVSIPKTEAGGSGKLFGRLSVVKP